MSASVFSALAADTAERIQATFLDDRDPMSKSRRSMMFGGLFLGVSTSLTAGHYFTALMLAMGADASYISWAGAIASICGVLQLLSPMLLERLPRRKPLLLLAKGLYHLISIVVIGVLPLLPFGSRTKLIVFMAALIAMHAINHLASPGITAWQMQCMTKEKSVDFYAFSQLGTTVLNQLSAFLAGLLLDRFELEGVCFGSISPTLSAILLLRGAALVFAALECLLYARVPELPYAAPTAANLRLVLRPLRDRRFLRAISFALLYTVAGGVIGQYFSIYLLEDVQMPYARISLAGFLSIPISILATPLWSRTLRRRPMLRVLPVAQLGYAAAYVLNAFITRSAQIFYFLCIICGSIFGIGLTVTHSNLLFLSCPEQNRTAYTGFYAIAVQLCTFLGNSLGILFVRAAGDVRLNVLGVSMCSRQYINLLAAALLIAIAVGTISIGKKSAREDIDSEEYNTVQ